MIEEKFEAAISDTDILIDLCKSDCLDILGLLFDKIYITEYIFYTELQKVSVENYHKIKAISDDAKFPFEIIWDKDIDIVTKNLKKALKNSDHRQYIVGPGELDCACYANATGINFVVSNNQTEFRFLTDIAIMLSYYHVISICFLHGKISYEKAEDLYIKINKVKKYSSCHTFANKLDLSMDYFKENNLISILRLDHID